MDNDNPWDKRLSAAQNIECNGFMEEVNDDTRPRDSPPPPLPPRSVNNRCEKQLIRLGKRKMPPPPLYPGDSLTDRTIEAPELPLLKISNSVQRSLCDTKETSAIPKVLQQTEFKRSPCGNYLQDLRNQHKNSDVNIGKTQLISVDVATPSKKLESAESIKAPIKTVRRSRNQSECQPNNEKENRLQYKYSKCSGGTASAKTTSSPPQDNDHTKEYFHLSDFHSGTTEFSSKSPPGCERLDIQLPHRSCRVNKRLLSNDENDCSLAITDQPRAAGDASVNNLSIKSASICSAPPIKEGFKVSMPSKNRSLIRSQKHSAYPSKRVTLSHSPVVQRQHYPTTPRDKTNDPIRCSQGHSSIEHPASPNRSPPLPPKRQASVPVEFSPGRRNRSTAFSTSTRSHSFRPPLSSEPESNRYGIEQRRLVHSKRSRDGENIRKLDKFGLDSEDLRRKRAKTSSIRETLKAKDDHIDPVLQELDCSLSDDEDDSLSSSPPYLYDGGSLSDRSMYSLNELDAMRGRTWNPRETQLSLVRPLSNGVSHIFPPPTNIGCDDSVLTCILPSRKPRSSISLNQKVSLEKTRKKSVETNNGSSISVTRSSCQLSNTYLTFPPPSSIIGEIESKDVDVVERKNSNVGKLLEGDPLETWTCARCALACWAPSRCRRTGGSDQPPSWGRKIWGCARWFLVPLICIPCFPCLAAYWPLRALREACQKSEVDTPTSLEGADHSLLHDQTDLCESSEKSREDG